MFYNRDNELNFLESKFASNQAELIIFWGRRRVGKTRLLQEFCMRKNGIVLIATTSSALDNMENFSSQFADYFDDTRLRLNPFKSWEEFLLIIQMFANTLR